VGGFKCRCADGYELVNKTHCKIISDIPISLLVSNRYYIRNVSVSGTVDLMVMNLQNAVALDFDWLEQKVYWSDVTSTGSNITRMSINDPQKWEVSNVIITK
jgi:integrin beta 2